MNKENRDFTTWKEVIVDFFEHKISKCKLFKARSYIDKKTKVIESEKNKKKLQNAIIAKEKKQKEYEELKKTAASTEIRLWIDATSKKGISIAKGKKIIKATHVLRFTHSSSASGGLLLHEKSTDMSLTTSSIKKKLTVDLAHNNGALITVSRFLALSLNGKQIIDLILDNDFNFLKPFVADDPQLKSWMVGFQQLVEIRQINTADKAKQTYFPISHQVFSANTPKYHIVVPLFPSSLAHEIDSVITTKKYGNEQKELNKVKKEKNQTFRKEVSIEYPNLAVMQFGGEHPKNVSMLNADRGGKAYLFTTQPPIWQSQLKPPITNKSFLHAGLNSYRVREIVGHLRRFLLRFQRIDLSIKNPEKKQWIDRWVNQLIDEAMIYAISIQNLPAGWSKENNVKLKLAHQYFLDPYRDDEQFQQTRQSSDWQNVICGDFADWLNRKLIGKNKQFSPQPEHTRIWKKIMAEELREQTQALAWDIKFQNREQQV